jgi:peptidyl-tRNA hydrolase
VLKFPAWQQHEQQLKEVKHKWMKECEKKMILTVEDVAIRKKLLNNDTQMFQWLKKDLVGLYFICAVQQVDAGLYSDWG